MLNKVQLIGRLGKNPVVKDFENGKKTTLNIATSKSWTNKETGRKTQETMWHIVVVFGRLAEVASEYLNKGDLVQIEGSIKYRKYNDKTGAEKSITEIMGSSLLMLGNKSAKKEHDEEKNPFMGEPEQSSDFPDEDIPF